MYWFVRTLNCTGLVTVLPYVPELSTEQVRDLEADQVGILLPWCSSHLLIYVVYFYDEIHDSNMNEKHILMNCTNNKYYNILTNLLIIIILIKKRTNSK